MLLFSLRMVKLSTISHDLGLSHSTVSTIPKDKHRMSEAVKGTSLMYSNDYYLEPARAYP